MSTVHEFICTQRKKFVVLIFESLVERYSRFTSIMQFAEELTNRNNLSPDDDSVDDALRQLKRSLQFNFQDTVAQIDLGLALGLRYQDNQNPPRVFSSFTNPSFVLANEASSSIQLPLETQGIDKKRNNYLIQEPVFPEVPEIQSILRSQIPNQTNSKRSHSSSTSSEDIPSDQEHFKPSKKIFSYFNIVQQSLFVDLDISTIDARQTASSISKNTNSNSIKQKLMNLKDQIIKLNYSDVITLIDSAVEEQTLREQFFAKKRAQLSQPSHFSSLNLTDKPKILPKIEYDEGNEFTTTISSSMIHKPSLFSKITREWNQDTSFQHIKTPKTINSNKNNTSLALKQSKLAFTKEQKAQHPKQSQQSYPFISKNSINPSQNSFNNSNKHSSHLPPGLKIAPKKSSIILMTRREQDNNDQEGNLKAKQIHKSICSSVPILPGSKSIKKDAQVKIQQKRNAQKENIDNNCNQDEGGQLQAKITRQSPMKEQRRKPLNILRKRQEEEQVEGQTSFFIEYLKDLIEQSTKCQLEVPKIFKSKQFYEQRCDPQFKSVGTRLSHGDKSFVVKLFKALDGKSLYQVHDLLQLPPTLVSGLVLRAIKGEFDSDGNESNDEMIKNQNSRDYNEEDEERDGVNYDKSREQYEENEENDDDYEDYHQDKEKQGKRLMFNL